MQSLVACLRLLERHAKGKTLIFCNRASSATILHTYLSRHWPSNSTPPSLLHGFVPESQRATLLSHFASPSIQTLICTDLLARGMDTTAVQHVIMYDFPKNPVDFVHRAGRTGRPGGVGYGRVSSLVCGEDRRLAEYIRLILRNKQKIGADLPEPKQL